MSYTDFAEKMLIALYQESENDEPYPEGITFGALIKRYGFPNNSRWIDRLAKEWQLDGFAEVSETLEALPDELEVEITGRGMRKVEESHGSKDGVGAILRPSDPVPPNALTTEDGDPIVTEDGDYIVTEDQNRVTEDGSHRVTEDGSFRVTEESAWPAFDENHFDPEHFDTGATTASAEALKVPSFVSANWTGITEKLGPEQRARIGELSGALLAAIKQSNLDKRSRITATKHIEAVQTLLEAPDPPWKAIVELLNNQAVTTFLVTVQILQLIWGAAN